MKLISVNVARPKTVLYRARTIRTGIFKEPVLLRVRVGPLNIEGDQQADLRVHGGPDKAVYAYNLESYDHWKKELGRELPYGQFGENLTVEGMPETRVQIGDVFRVGGALLQVSEPRAPCYKLAMKMDDPQFLREFLASGRTGFYLRVLEEGEIGAGDSIELVSADPEGVTVEQMTRRVYGKR